MKTTPTSPGFRTLVEANNLKNPTVYDFYCRRKKLSYIASFQEKTDIIHIYDNFTFLIVYMKLIFKENIMILADIVRI